MTTTDIVRRDDSTPVRWEDDELMKVLREQIAPKATPAELRLFGEVCNRRGLDPFAGQIHCVHRYSRKEGREVMAIQTSIDGFRLIARRSGDYAGQDEAEWCGPDGVWRDVWLSPELPRAARVRVHLRSGGSVPAVAHWDEYAPTYPSGDLMGMWGDMPRLMIAKVAEALALRKAFPEELSGLYTADEMAQAEDVVSTPAAIDRAGDTPPRADGAPERDRPAPSAAPLDDEDDDPITPEQMEALAEYREKVDALPPGGARAGALRHLQRSIQNGSEAGRVLKTLGALSGQIDSLLAESDETGDESDDGEVVDAEIADDAERPFTDDEAE